MQVHKICMGALHILSILIPPMKRQIQSRNSPEELSLNTYENTYRYMNLYTNTLSYCHGPFKIEKFEDCPLSASRFRNSCYNGIT